jgi:hypothetical protein
MPSSSGAASIAGRGHRAQVRTDRAVALDEHHPDLRRALVLASGLRPQSADQLGGDLQNPAPTTTAVKRPGPTGSRRQGLTTTPSGSAS